MCKKKTFEDIFPLPKDTAIIYARSYMFCDLRKLYRFYFFFFINSNTHILILILILLTISGAKAPPDISELCNNYLFRGGFDKFWGVKPPVSWLRLCLYDLYDRSVSVFFVRLQSHLHSHSHSSGIYHHFPFLNVFVSSAISIVDYSLSRHVVRRPAWNAGVRMHHPHVLPPE